MFSAEPLSPVTSLAATRAPSDPLCDAAGSSTTPAVSGGGTLVIREGSTADASLLGRLHATSWQMTYKGIMSDDFLASRVFAEREAHWQQKMRDWDPAHGDIRIAELDGEPIAFVTIVDDREPQYGVYLDHLHVMPGHKGTGAGKRLIALAEQWARSRGARQMYLLAWEANLPARGFYEHLGWYCAEKFEDELVETRAMACRYILKLEG